MSKKSSFKLSQGYDVISPKRGKAYPILCEDWNNIKYKIDKLSNNSNIYSTIGSICLGGSLTTFISIITGAIQSQNQKTYIISWSTVIITLLTGILSIYFSNEQQKIKKIYTSDIIEQMNTIENKYKKN